MSKIVWKYFENTNTVMTDGLKIPYSIAYDDMTKEYEVKYGLETIGKCKDQKEAFARAEEFLNLVGNGGVSYMKMERKEIPN